jgi:diguanylate cyclase (GGDEF)-like protein
MMREMFRHEDALFRYGGEEFVVVLIADDAAGARAALERFRTRLAARRFPQLEQVTVSIGFVEILDGEVVSGVVGKADKALYHSKTSGRNRTTAYADLLATGAVAETQVYGAVDLF